VDKSDRSSNLMPTTTPSFGWPVPVSTDLVKDGATAIESLGDAIDASMTDLKGGTTGQVLAKASNTDMDFTWTTASAGSSNVAGKNGVLNSNFSIWQRGTSIAGSAGSYLYTADRWQTNASTALTVSRQATGDTTNLPFIQYCARVQRNSGSTATAAAVLSQSFESVNSIPYAGRTVTISFYARRGANFSGASNQLEVYLTSGTGTDQNAFVGGFTGATSVVYQTPTLTTTWQRFSYSATVGTSATQLATQFTYTPTGTAGAADFYEVTGVQVEIASSASAYSPNAATFQGELAACQRYYWRTTAAGTIAVGSGTTEDANRGIIFINNPVPMRVAPTSVDAATLTVTDMTSYTLDVTSVTGIVFGTNGGRVTFNTSGGQSTNRAAIGQTKSTGGHIGFSAEL
jgi:hypothetical protein